MSGNESRPPPPAGPRAFFITGTDTGVGKTIVGASLLAAAVASGQRAAALKPVESGCSRDDQGNLVAADAELLREAAGAWQRAEDVCFYRYEAAVAPGVAATHGREIDFRLIGGRLAALRSMQELAMIVIEGAGGLLVPYGDDRMTPDLIRELAVPILIVGRAGLGTINHTCMTVECARQRELEIAGVILVCSRPEPEPLLDSNRAEIEAATGVAVLGVLPYTEHSLKALAHAGAPIVRRLLSS